MLEKTLRSADLSKPLSYEDYDYELHVLQNGIRALLASSSKIDKAACCIGVGVGSLRDPLDYQGLAHFCEHMLFMGNARYPDETEYNSFIQKNGGSSNAFTSENETVYYGTVQPSALEGLVDRTIEFFLSPSFNDSAVDREVEAVHSEFEKGLQEDARRKHQVWKKLANPQSAYSKFNVGNNEHLRRLDKFDGNKVAALSALRSALIDFHSNHYSSNEMSAVVMGPQSLAELREMVLPRLAKVVNKKIDIPKGAKAGVPNPPFRMEDLQKAIYVVPVREMDKSVSFKFAIDDQFDFWREKPTNYISHVLGHEGSDSLLSILKSKGLATGLSAGVRGQNIGQSFFVISLESTERGLQPSGIKEAGLLIFAAIRQLLEAGLILSAVEEERKIEEMRWRFQPMTEVHEFAIQGVISLLTYPPEFVFEGPYLSLDIDLNVIKETLEKMTQVANLNVVITGRAFEAECTQTEGIFGTKYCCSPLPFEWVHEWAAVQSMSAEDFAALIAVNKLKLPDANVYIAERLELKGAETDLTEAPRRLDLNHSRVEFYLKREESFKIPEIVFAAEIYLPWMSPTEDEFFEESFPSKIDPKSEFRDLPWSTRLALLSIYQRAVTESLNEITYDAQVAGLSFALRLYRGTGKGAPSFSLVVEGFDDKADVLLKTVLDRLKAFDFEPEHIDVAITVLERTCANRLVSTPPYQLVQLRASQSLCPTLWDDNEMLRNFRMINPELVREILTDSSGKIALNKIFEGSFLQGLVSGNVTEEEARDTLLGQKEWGELLQPSKSDPAVKRLPNGQIDLALLSKEAMLQDGANFTPEKISDDHFLRSLVIQAPTLNKDDPNGAVQLILQANGSGIADLTFQNILSVWLSDKFFDDLRTRQTLGYVVGMTLQEQGNRLLRGFLVQSTKHPTSVINAILIFINEWCFNTEGEIAPKLTAEELAAFCEAVIAQLSEKPKKLLELHNRFYGEIKTGRYDFERRQKQIDYIKQYTMEDLTADLKGLLTTRPWLILSVQPKEDKCPEEINQIGGKEILPLDLFHMKGTKSIIRHALSRHSEAAFIKMVSF